MRDIVKEYQKKFRRNHQRARRYTALLLALALTTSLFVNWQLHGVGIAKTAEYLCGELEHEHTAACYEKQLVCGYEEGEPEDWNATSDSAIICRKKRPLLLHSNTIRCSSMVYQMHGAEAGTSGS